MRALLVCATLAAVQLYWLPLKNVGWCIVGAVVWAEWL